jgi:hypothetical protein
MSINPYESPLSAPDPETPASVPAFKLYGAGHIAWAVFLGSPLAGGVLLAVNYWRLRDTSSGWLALIASSVVTLALIAIGLWLPDRFPSVIFPVIPAFAMWQAAKYVQGDRVEQHLARGGGIASSWGATGIGILTGLLVLAAIFGVSLLLPES